MTRDNGRQLNKAARERERQDPVRANVVGPHLAGVAEQRPATPFRGPTRLQRRSLSLRSPALESAEQRRAERAPVSQQKRSAASHSSKRSSGRALHYAAEEAFSRPAHAMPRKRLPRKGAAFQESAVGKGDRGTERRIGIPMGLRLRAPWKDQAQEAAAPIASKVPATRVQFGEVEAPGDAEREDVLLSEEEKKKLDTLEMSLPRVAGKIDSWLLILVLALLCIGIVMVFSASSFIAARYQGDASYYFQRELIWALLGIVAMLVTMRIDYRQWRRISLAGMVIILPLLVIVLRFGVTAYGASRWLSFGSFFSFQPSELTKLVLALYIADWLARKGKQVSSFLYGLAPFIILVGIVLGLVLLENDMGTAIIIAGFATAMFFSAGANIIQFMLAMACGGLIFLQEAFKGYRYYRLTGFLNPFKDITSINLQLYQALLGLGSGGWFGLGLGASRQKTGYLPFPYTDSIFPIIGEELGFVGCAVIVILFLCLAFRGFRLARRTPDLYGSLLATGITTWLILQAMINIGANTASIPYTGVPLPFISFGGSSLVVSLAAVGVLLNISRYIREPETPALSRQTLAFGKKRDGARYVTSS